MAQTHDHEIVSIYPFSDEEIDQLMHGSIECVLMWSTKDGWPVGVIHAFLWHEGKIWLTFASHRHRAAAIRRDNRVSVSVSAAGYPPGTEEGLPEGGITFKGHGEFFDDEDTKSWFYPALCKKINPDDEAAQKAFHSILDSPLRTVLAVTPVKKIMYNGSLATRHISGQANEDELGSRLSSDAVLMNKERKKRGLDPR
jgi:hypothetical protein